MTDLRELLGRAAPPAPQFDARELRRMIDRRWHRRRAIAISAGALALITAIASIVTLRDRPTRVAVVGPASTDATAPLPTTVGSLPKLPASSVRAIRLVLPAGVAIGASTVASGQLWFAACARAVCPIVHFDLRSGAEDSRARFASPEPEVARITAGDGALFALTADYKGLPYHVSRIDPATGATEWTVPVPGTSVVGEVSRARLAFGLGSLWFSAGTQSVLRISPANGHVTGTIHVPAAVEDSGNVGIAFGANAVWLASDSPRAAVMRIDARTLGASVVQRFGAGFTQSLAATDGAVWTTHAATPAGLELTRIGTSAPYPADAFAIPTPNVAASDQSVWFQGWEPAEKAYDPANRYGIIGRVDPSSGNVVGAVELRIGPLDDVNLFVVGTDVYVLDTTARTLTEVRGGSR